MGRPDNKRRQPGEEVLPIEVEDLDVLPPLYADIAFEDLPPTLQRRVLRSAAQREGHDILGPSDFRELRKRVGKERVKRERSSDRQVP